MAAATTQLKPCPLYMCFMVCIKRGGRGFNCAITAAMLTFGTLPKGVPVKNYKWQLLLLLNL